MRRSLASISTCAVALTLAQAAYAQPRLRPNPGIQPPAGPPGQPAPPGGPVPPGGPTPPAGPAHGDTQDLKQFEEGVEYAPRNPNFRVSFNLEDTDLPELVRVIGELTGKRFIFGGKIRNIKATVFSPQKVTVAEAYQAFLSILETNGLTVIPHGRFLKIVDSQGVNNLDTPLYTAGERSTDEDRFVTRMHRLSHVSADDVAAVLGHFKTKEGDIVVYGPGNMIIITDTGPNIRRMMEIIQDIDVGGAGDQIWIEPIHYGAASEIANRLNEVFDLKGAAAAAGPQAKPGGGSTSGTGTGDLHISKIIADDRSNSLVIIATERAYLRILEFIKRIDLPRSTETGEIHVLPLQHADAVDLSKTLTDIITGAATAGQPAAAGGAPRSAGPGPGIFEAGIKVSADKSTNSIIVTSSLRDYASLREVIDKLDQPRRQVFIEAVVMDLTITRQNQLGVAFHGGDAENTTINGNSGQTLLLGGLNPFRTIGIPNPTDPTLQALALDIRGPGITGSENILGTGISIPAFGVLLNAMAGTNDADILSTPHVLATDNTPAEIQVVQNIATQQNAGAGLAGLPGLGGTTGATNPLGALGGLGGLGGFGGGAAPRVEVGTKIKMTPHLNDSNEVRLEVQEEISDVTGDQPQGTLGVVPFARRVANTTLVVKDQQTVVIGGLVRNRVAHSTTKIPLLGDIPVLGALFRSSTDKLEKSNLILVLTPHIVRDQEDLRTIFERKMQERQEFLDHYFVFSDQGDYQPPKDYSRTYGLLEDIRQAYVQVDEKRKLDELHRKPEIRTHEPGEPLEMPAPIGRTGATATTAPGPLPPGNPNLPGQPAPPQPAAPTPPPGLNVTPPVRQIERIER
jgi:general secretion pathway protein D